MQSIIKKIVWVSLCIVPFIVLHVADGGKLDVISWFSGSSLFFPFISGKNVLFRIFVEVAFAGWAVLALYNHQYRINIKKSPIILAYGLFMVVLLIADMFGISREKAIWSNFERMEGFIGHIHLFAYFFVLTVMVRTEEEWKKMWKVFIAANLLVLIYAYGQLLGAKGLFFANNFPQAAEWFSSRFAIHMSQNRLDATIGNSAYFAIFCLMNTFIALLLWSKVHWSKKQWLYPVVIILNIVGLLYSGTRGAMIGLFIGGFVTFGIMAWHGGKRIKKIFIGIAIIGLVLTSSIFLFKNSSFIKSSPVLSRISTISPKDGTGDSRLAMWTISYEAWKEKPLLGYGQDNFSHIFAEKFLPDRMCNLEPWYDRSHNVFFDWLVAAGLLGLITYLSLYGVTLWFMWRKENDMTLSEKAILTGALVGYFIHNFFVFDNLTSYILFFALLAYITVRTKSNKDTEHNKPFFDNDQMNLLVIPVIGIVLLIVFYTVNMRPLIVNQLVIKAMSARPASDTAQSYADMITLQKDSFVSAIALDTLGSLEAREQFLQAAVRLAQNRVPETLAPQERQLIVTAINNLLLAARNEVIASYPQYKEDVRMLSIYAMFFNGIGDTQSAKEVLKEAIRLAPNKQLLRFDLIRALLIEQKYKEAYALSKETYDLSTTCLNADKWFLVSASYFGKFQEGSQYVISKGGTPTIDQDIISGVVASGQHQLAIELLQNLKKQNPQLTTQIDELIKQIRLAPRK